MWTRLPPRRYLAITSWVASQPRSATFNEVLGQNIVLLHSFINLLSREWDILDIPFILHRVCGHTCYFQLQVRQLRAIANSKKWFTQASRISCWSVTKEPFTSSLEQVFLLLPDNLKQTTYLSVVAGDRLLRRLILLLTSLLSLPFSS